MNAPKSKPRKWKDWLSLGWEILWDRKRLGFYLKDEFIHAKRFPLLLICSIIFSLLIAYSATSCRASRKLEKVTSDYQNTNSFISGQLANTGNQLDKAQKDLEKKTSDYATTIADLKADHNTILQEKNAEILKLTGEKDSALNRVSQLQALPDTAFLVLSNANLISRLDYKGLDFEPKINGSSISNYLLGQVYVIPLANPKEIKILIPHLSDNAKSVEKLTVDFLSPINVTNFSGGILNNWWQPLSGSEGQIDGRGCTLEIICEHTITQETGWTLTPLAISTNFTDSFFSGRLTVFAPGFNGVKSYIGISAKRDFDCLI